MTAALVIAGRQWLWLSGLAVAVLLLLLVWGYARRPGPRALRWGCALLKGVGVLALAACVLEPLSTHQQAKPGANFLAVLADNSLGMQIKDPDASQTRAQLLQRTLREGALSWYSSLAENYQLRNYLFDTRLRNTADFSELSFEGRGTALLGALRSLAERYQGQPLAGVLVFTDGNATDLPPGALDTRGLPPIYPVTIGGDQAIRDVALVNAAVSQTAFEDAPVTIQATVGATGCAGESVTVQLLDAEERKVLEESQRVPANHSSLTFHLRFKPQKAGLSFYHLRAAVSGELDQFARTNLLREATLANNRRAVAVQRGQGPYRILYASGRPNWEFKFLNRALAEDDQIQLVGLIRAARREPKFEFRGRAGETSNPLYRGFGQQAGEEIERYDQPVLIRLNTRDAAELAGGFPKTPEELFTYHAVILDDLEAEFFSRDQLLLLQKFVSERGGGFLMLGGFGTFRDGGYQKTPVGDLLPVYLDTAPAGPPAARLRLQLTREGWLEPWARLRQTETDERSRLEAMPPFHVLSPMRGAKPGASVLATVTDERGQSHPALVGQRFGHGRVGALLLGDFWQWGLKNESLREDMDKAWRQLIRWLVAEVPERTELEASPKPTDQGGAVLLQVRARDQTFKPLENATVMITVQPQSGTNTAARVPPAAGATGAATNAIRIAAEASPSGPGVFQATYYPREAGAYRAEAMVTGFEGAETGRAAVGWASDPILDEFSSLTPNHALLGTLARQTGGALVSLNALEDFARTAPNRSAPILETRLAPLWHKPTVFLFALFCFIAEWGLRRWRGMP